MSLQELQQAKQEDSTIKTVVNVLKGWTIRRGVLVKVVQEKENCEFDGGVFL